MPPRSKSPAPKRSPATDFRAVTPKKKSKWQWTPEDTLLSVVGAVAAFTALHFADMFLAPLGYSVFPNPTQGANVALAFFARGYAFKRAASPF